MTQDYNTVRKADEQALRELDEALTAWEERTAANAAKRAASEAQAAEKAQSEKDR